MYAYTFIFHPYNNGRKKTLPAQMKENLSFCLLWFDSIDGSIEDVEHALSSLEEKNKTRDSKEVTEEIKLETMKRFENLSGFIMP